MKNVLHRVFNIFITLIFICSIIINILSHRQNIGTYYLYKTFAWANFVKVTVNMSSDKFSYGTIYSKNILEGNKIKLIEDSFKKADNDTKTIFGQTILYPVRIVAFNTSEEYYKAVRNSHNTAGVYDKYAFYLPMDKIADYIIIHEYTHYKMESFCKDNKINSLSTPIWFQEGVAEYIGFKYGPDKSLNSLKKVKNFRELNNRTDITAAEKEGYDVYYQSCLAIKKIIQLKGEKAIQDILLDSKSMDFYNAFEKNTGLSIENFQKLLK